MTAPTHAQQPSMAPADREDRPSGNAFAYRNYRLFFAGQLVSVTGLWMQILAMSWLIVESLQANAFQLGLLQAFQFGPVLLLSIPAGILADRFAKRSVLIVTQSLLMLWVSLLAWLVMTDQITLWQVYAISTAMGITQAIDMPTRQAIVSELVETPALKNAIAMNAAMFNLGRLLGPALAGVVLATWGPEACFAINAVSFLAPIAGYSMMRLPAAIRQRGGTAIQHLQDGITFIRKTPDILFPLILVGVVATMGLNHNVWLPLIARNSLHANERTYSFLFSSIGVGALIGALTIARSQQALTFRRVLVGAACLGGSLLASAIAAAMSLGAPVVIGLMAINGFFIPYTTAGANTIVQTIAPPDKRGRIMAVFTTVFLGTTPIGGLVSGALAGAFGVEAAMAAAALAILAVVAAFRRRLSATSS